MTTTPQKRPSSRPKHTRTTDAKAEAELEQGLRITVDGESYEVRVGDVDSTVTRELRAKSGMSFNTLMTLCATDPDADVIAAFVWLARRMRGEVVALDDVVITYHQMLSDGFDVALPGDREDGEDLPEA